jgi:hypothetical protein
MSDENLIKGLTDVVNLGHDLTYLVQVFSAIDCIVPRNTRVAEFKATGKHILKIVFGMDSDFYKEFMKLDNDNSDINLQKQAGVLEAAIKVLRLGLLEDMIFQNDKVVFSDILTEAKECLKNQRYIIVGVYGMIIIESVVKEYAKLKLSKDDYDECNKPRSTNSDKFHKTIQKLENKNIIYQNVASSLISNYNIGSHAAHNDNEFQEKYSNKREMEKLLKFIENEVLSLK